MSSLIDYHYILLYSKEGQKAKAYLRNRRIHEETIKELKKGFSPYKSETTFQLLKAKGFNEKELMEYNIFRLLNNGYPSNVLRNRIVSFSRYRILIIVPWLLAAGLLTMIIKYLNSAESDKFKKEDSHFGFSQAKDDIEKKGYAILFEGYFDVLTAHQNGVTNTLASLGTVLARNQALLLKAITNDIVIAYDGDEAGMVSSFRSASVLAGPDCNVRIAHIEKGLGPDECISSYGGDSFISNVINQAKDIKLTLIDYKKQNYNLTNATERYGYAEEILKGILNNNKNDEQVLEILEDVMGLSFKKIQKFLVNVKQGE